MLLLLPNIDITFAAIRPPMDPEVQVVTQSNFFSVGLKLPDVVKIKKIKTALFFANFAGVRI